MTFFCLSRLFQGRICASVCLLPSLCLAQHVPATHLKHQDSIFPLIKILMKLSFNLDSDHRW